VYVAQPRIRKDAREVGEKANAAMNRILNIGGKQTGICGTKTRLAKPMSR
jgi:hypothetical protein